MKKLTSMVIAGIMILGMLSFSSCAFFSSKNDNPAMAITGAAVRN